jgi:nucleotide-binding universal stress UspA family protein
VPKEILVPLDGSALADEAVAHAAEIARRVDGSLHLVRVHTPLSAFVPASDSPISIPDPVIDERIRSDAAQWLDDRAHAVGELNDVPVTWELRVGSPEVQLVLASQERRTRMMVCTTRGAGGAAMRLLGSVTDSVLRHAKCPMLMMTPVAVRRDVQVRSLLILTDGSEASSAIVPHAKWLASAFGANVDCMQLMHPPENPAAAIRRYIDATGPDVIALATHGRGLTRLYTGSVAEELVRTVDRPILVFRPTESSWTNIAPPVFSSSSAT